jgi:hypothetical protein
MLSLTSAALSFNAPAMRVASRAGVQMSAVDDLKADANSVRARASLRHLPASVCCCCARLHDLSPCVASRAC